MPEITRSLRGQKNDTNTRKDAWWYLSDYNWFGQKYCHWWECFPFGEDWELNCSLRFAYFSVPAGSVVSRAHLLLTAKEDDDHPNCHALISAEDVADPTRITSYDDFFARPRTAQTVPWLNVPPFKKWEPYRTPDLTTIVQHLIDTYPDTRKHIQFFIEDNDSDRDARRVFRQGPGYRGNPAQIYIEYDVTPPPVATKWLITDMAHAWSHTGKALCVTTDVPCHLYLRFKDEPPAWHQRTTYRRGVPDTRDPGWEMKEFEQREQIQEGDTLAHLFDLDPFPPKERIWYYFIGTIAGGDVKSRSPFFRQTYDPLIFTDLFIDPWGCIPTPQPEYALLFYEEWTA